MIPMNDNPLNDKPMNDDIKDLWQSQPARAQRPQDIAEMVPLVRARAREIEKMASGRDYRETLAAVALAAGCVWLGIRQAMPWTWYLIVPGLLWVGAFLGAEKRRRGRIQPTPEDSLRTHLERSLVTVEREMQLLRTVAWWYLLPVGVPMAVFLAHLAWLSRSETGSAPAVVVSVLLAMLAVGWGLFAINQRAVKTELMGRRDEVRRILSWMDDVRES